MHRTKCLGVVLSGLLVAACAPRGPGGGGGAASTTPVRGGGAPTTPVRSAGTVYRTSAMGEAVGGVKAGPGGGKTNELFKAGLITLAVSYGATVVGGQLVALTFTEYDEMIGAQTSIDRLWIPVIGAWSGFAHNVGTVGPACGNCTESVLGSIAIGVGAAAQTTGVVLMVIGLLRSANEKAGGGSKRFVVAPHASSETAGMVVTGAF